MASFLRLAARECRVSLPLLFLTSLASVPFEASVASAFECDESIRQGDPCTISGVHQLEQNCSLDFGERDVTIGPNGALIWPEIESEGQIHARNLTVQGSIQAIGQHPDRRDRGLRDRAPRAGDGVW